MVSSILSLARTPVSLTPVWLMSTVATFSEKILPTESVPKMRTGNSTDFRGSRRLPINVFAFGCDGKGAPQDYPDRPPERMAVGLRRLPWRKDWENHCKGLQNVRMTLLRCRKSRN